MKCNIFGALMIIAVALLVSAPMTQAQARAKANVPFDFNLDQSSMPAGTYEIGSLSSGILVVRNLQTREARLMIESMHVETPQASKTPHAQLLFRKYDGQYFLAEIWDGQSMTGIAFPESKRERELKLASNPAPEVVIIAMK